MRGLFVALTLVVISPMAFAGMYFFLKNPGTLTKCMYTEYEPIQNVAKQIENAGLGLSCDIADDGNGEGMLKCTGAVVTYYTVTWKKKDCETIRSIHK